MNKIIKVIRISTPEQTKQSLKNIVDQLELYNYAITDDNQAKRLFMRFLPEYYKKNNIVYCSSNIIAVNPMHCIERKDMFSFKIKIK